MAGRAANGVTPPRLMLAAVYQLSGSGRLYAA
jgi:hypothetical protein